MFLPPLPMDNGILEAKKSQYKEYFIVISFVRMINPQGVSVPELLQQSTKDDAVY